MQPFLKTIKQRGFSMVELLLASAIIMALGTFVLSFNAQRENDQKVIKLISGHKAFVSTIHDVGANLPNYFIDWYGSLNVSNSASSLPYSIRYSAPVGGTPPLRSVFDGYVTISGFEQLGPSNGDTFPGIAMVVISYFSLPNSACFKLVNAVGPESFDTYINGTRVQLTPPGTLTDVNLTQVSGLCAGNNNTVQIASIRPFAKGLLPSDSSTSSSFQSTLMTKYATLNAQRIAMHP